MNEEAQNAGKIKILRERAIALARSPEAQESEGERLELLEFILAQERYAIESVYVREVYPLTEFTPIPGTPAFILGIINVRGQILSVTNLKKFFDLPEKGLTDLNKVVILRKGGMEFGLLADAVVGIRFVSLSEIQPSLSTLTGIRSKYLRGVTPDALVILDAAKILSDPKMIVQEDGL